MIPARACGSCSLCCKLLRIEELDKLVGAWCPHCRAGSGCQIYEARPHSCRSFHCQWLIDSELGPEWYPTTAKMVLCYDASLKRLAVYVDPDFPSAWRTGPYYRQLKTWACKAIELAQTRWSDAWLMAPILVYIDERIIVVLPNQDIEVGTFTAGDHLVVTERATPSGGREFDAHIVPLSDTTQASGLC